MNLHPLSHRTSSHVLPLLSLAFALGACAPLQQAPLVYTSGVTVGLKVGVSPAQADAFETVIGFKMLDAAYVPVAVSKPDIDGPESSKAKVHEIYGQFGEEITPEAVRQLNAGELEAVKVYLGTSADFSRKKDLMEQANSDYNTAKASLAKSVKADDDARTKVESARKVISGLKDLKISACNLADPTLALSGNDWSKSRISKVKEAVDTCSETLRQSAADGNVDVLKSVQDILKTAQDILANADTQLVTPVTPSTATVTLKELEAKAKSEAKVADANFRRAKGDLEGKEKAAMEALQKLANIRKRDALSVYGSFNGSLDQSVANKGPTIGSKLGKVFSTGVAAQNLTEAAKISATSEAFSQCVVNVKDLAGVMKEEKDKQEFIKQAIEHCSNGAKK